MPWLFLLLALGALVLAFSTTSVPLAAIALLLALVFIVIGVLGLLAQRRVCMLIDRELKSVERGKPKRAD